MKLLNRPLLSLIFMSFLLAGCHIFNPKSQEKSHSPSLETSSNSSQSTLDNPSHNKHISGQDSQSRYDTIWQRIRAGYGLPTVSDTQLNTYLRFYVNNQNYINRFSTQAVPYLHYVVSEMEANDIPLELALIPIIESSYNPHVSSPSNTVGIWQFVPETGRNFGLKQNTWYNGRKDVIASTDAAIRYLKKLHADFGSDWLLVVAAYNAGEGTVNNAIAKNKRAGKPTDFWSLPLPKHTQTYIPQLLALAKVIGDPERYHVTLNDIPDTAYFVKINVDKQINLAQAAKQANINAAELKKLNSGINGWLTSPTGDYPILVPVEDAAAFTLQLDSLPKISTSQSIETSNENMINTKVTTADKAGNTNTTKNKNKKVTKEVQDKNKESQHYYTVKAGDSLWTIAKAKNISVKTLAKINNLSPVAALKPGQKLLLSSDVTASIGN